MTRWAALTFDTEHPDGPDCPPDAAARIVAALAESAVRATFFLQGSWASAHPDLARRIADDGHVVGNHSYAHPNLTRLRTAGLAEEVRAAEAAIRTAAGVDPRPWFRCPYGTHSHRDGIAETLRALGYHDAHWNVTPADWDAGLTAAQLTERVVTGVCERDDAAVVLLHSWPAAVPDALPAIVEVLRGKGFRFATVEELSRDPGSDTWLRSRR